MTRPNRRFENSIATFGIGMLLLWAASAHCQPLPQTQHSGVTGDIEWMLTPLGFPCEPGDAILPVVTCPPFEEQGFVVWVRSAEQFDFFRIEVTYRDRAGVEKKISDVIPRSPGENPQGGGPAWAAVWFRVGRLSVPHLPDGVKAVRMSIEKLRIAGAAGVSFAQ